jgi:hypothetical protein
VSFQSQVPLLCFRKERKEEERAVGSLLAFMSLFLRLSLSLIQLRAKDRRD